MRIKRLQGLMVTVAVAVTPIALWITFGEFRAPSDPTQTIDMIAKAAALSGLALLAFNIILSARLSVLEGLFLGLDRSYRAHRLIGGSTVMLLMLHAVLITTKYSSISLLSGYEYLKPNLDLPLMLGKVALAVMVALVTLSLYVRIKYQWFVMTQRLLGACIFLGGYHALFVSGSDLRSNIPLLIYFAGLGGLAAGLYVYRSLFRRSLKRKLEYEVDSVSSTEGITTIMLSPKADELQFYAGQFAFFRFSSDAVDTESHPFSISSGSDEKQLRIAVKASGDYTEKIGSLKQGDSVWVEGPYGHFSFTKIRSTRQVWVAGGIGITPFLSMARSLPAGHRVKLYYCVRTLRQAVFLPELRRLADENPGLEVSTVCDEQGQKLSVAELVAGSPEDYLLCAPPAMMKALAKQLRARRVAPDRVHYEDFALT